MPDDAARPSFSLGRSLLFSLVIVLGFFGVAEAILRMVGVEEPVRPRILLRSMDMDVSFPFMQPDPELFWSLRPGFRGEFQGRAVTINALGLRGPEVQLPKPPGRRRVVCFGDSIAFGFGVGDGETYATRLAEALAGRGVDAVNAGVTGYTSHQVLGLLRRVAPVVQADVATFCVGWNDGNERSLNDRDYARRVGTLQAVEGALDHVYVYRFAKGLYLRTEARRVRRGGKAVTAAERGGDPTGKGARVPVAQYRENLAAIVEECRARGIRPVFIPLPMRKRKGDPSFESPYPAALVEAGRRLGVLVLDIGELASGAPVERNEDGFIDQIHLSPSGHERLARELARQLLAKGIL